MSLHSNQVADEIEYSDVTSMRRPPGAYTLTLQVVPLEQVVPHEHYHEPRVNELAARLAMDGKLINPPIVVRQKQKYVVLDGATRLTAMRHLGYPYIVVQVVDMAQQQVQLTSWNHAIYGGSAAGLLAVLRGVPGLQLTPVSGVIANNVDLTDGALGYLVSAENEGFLLEAHTDMTSLADPGWLGVLNRAVEAYGKWGNVERTLSADLQWLASQFPDLAAFVLFPRFTPETIFELAEQGRTVPAGITRFIIPGRILRLNAPLDWLMVDEPLNVKQAWLDNLIREKLVDRQVRYYEEPVVLLDE